ncbi:MAG: hypothetical protein M1833_004781 [Piccolia ochrophora]|nr:MAG: hypothetical protein M1833_004781 [Piccolia ochrophora]
MATHADDTMLQNQSSASTTLTPIQTQQRPLSDVSGVSSPLSPTTRHNHDAVGGAQFDPVASKGNPQPASSESSTRDTHRDVRTLPPWVKSLEEAEEEELLLPHAQIAQHNHTPSGKHRPEPGRLHDAYRERDPVTINQPISEHASRWKHFAQVSAFPTLLGEDGEQVDAEWLEKHMGDLEAPWRARREPGDEEAEGTLFSNRAKRKAWYLRLERSLLRNPMVPLVFRLIILTFSTIALALGGSIFALSEKYDFRQRASTLMAIIFDAIALIYIFYITYDEYSGKPLGLRSPRAKIRLILLDLFFIVFNSANLSLAFDALTDVRWSCRESNGQDPGAQSGGGTNDQLCDRQRALSGTLLVALIAWLTTFAISVFRLVERVVRN